LETKSLKLESIINSWTTRHPNVSLVTEDGLSLVSAAFHVADICSLPSAVQATHQYLKLKENELAICNDPYTGGSIPSHITLVTAFRLKNYDSLLLLGHRIATRPKLNFGKTVDEEGLKIPPTPAGYLNEPAHPVLDAIAAHPFSPDDFKERIQKGVAALREAKTSFIYSAEMFNLDLNRQLCQSYVQTSHLAAQSLLSEFAHGHAEVQWNLEGGEKIRLQLENTGSRLNLDFTGTTYISGLHLTESHVLGCAVRVLQQVTGHFIPINSGSLLAFNLTIPRNSALSSQSPKPTTFGVLVGSNLICDIILRALSLLNPKRKKMRSNSLPMILTFSFGERNYYDLLSSGSLATPDKRGEPGIDTWNESGLSPSIEEVEARFPLEILALKKRADSGGQGDQRGGDGILKSYRLLQDAKLKWFFGYPIKNETNTNSGQGQAPQIILINGDNEITHTELKGEVMLPAGTIVTALSRGGHAF